MESNHHCYKYKTFNDRYHNLMFYINNTFVPLDIIIVQNLPDQYGYATFTTFTEAVPTRLELAITRRDRAVSSTN